MNKLHLSLRFRVRRGIGVRRSRGRYGKSSFDTSFKISLLVIHRIVLQNAAKRMVAYWDMRRKICGEAAVLPLLTTRHGALNTEAIALLHDGHVVRLMDDLKGRTVLRFSISVALGFNLAAASFGILCCS